LLIHALRYYHGMRVDRAWWEGFPLKHTHTHTHTHTHRG